MPTYFGTIVEIKKCNNNVFIIANDNEIYSLIQHHIPTDTTDIILRVSDLSYIEFKLKERINMINDKTYQ